MSRRRILLAVSSLSCGGAERVISELAGALAQRHHVGVLTLAPASSDHYSLPPAVERIALNLLWDSKNLYQAVRGNIRRNRMIRHAVRGYAPDAVVSFIEQTNVRVLTALLGTGVPVIVSERIDPRRYDVGRMWNLARRLMYPFAARVVVQTPGVANWAGDLVGHRRVCVIPNFVRPLPPPVTNGRAEDFILAVGRLDVQKGHDLLIQAFARSGLPAKGLRLVILGEGPARPFLERLVDELGLSGVVHLAGVVRDPERWMARATVFVLASRYEGFPNALLEAMAMGCPVIATDCESGPREIVRDGVDGLLVPTDSIEELALALRRLLRDAELRLRLGSAAVEVRRRFARERIVQQWQALIEEVIRERGD